jgi:uncharacterized membrane protein
MLAEVARFSDWLSLTPVSMFLQTVAWIIPMVQSVHILAIAVVMSSVIMVDLRLLGLVGRGQPLSGLSRRFLPWVWWSLLVLLITGIVLITAEPRRDLLNPMFQAKMALLAAAMIVTAALQTAVSRNVRAWDAAPERRRGPWIIAAASLLLWAAIVGCGRWIAYVEHG